MPFIIKRFPTTKGQKVQLFLQNVVGLSSAQSQRLLAKGRVFDENNQKLQSGQILKCDFLNVSLFQGVTKGLKPIFNTKDFAIFDKPSGIMVHPISKHTKYSLLDEIRYHFGDNANLAHRIDLETSGLVLITKNKYADVKIKAMIENRQFFKKYLALVNGKIDKKITINTPIAKDSGQIKIKMKVDKNGKPSITIVEPLKYYQTTKQTLIQATILTGRQHQIRIHLHSIGHTIVGDPIYGVDENIADKYLNKELSNKDRIKYTKAIRLMLQANFLKFCYNDVIYSINSKLTFP
jgi:23S rRNA pseudouridine1911/1915/1917 synthase